MGDPREFTYVIKKGDNLYHLSQRFQTTVQSILNHNPFIDPYNLQTGSQIIVYAGKNYAAAECAGLKNGLTEKEAALSDTIRLAWLQHVYWTRMLLISIAQRLNDQSEVTDRLLMNPGDIAAIFAEYYTADAAKAIGKLLTEHLIIGAELITVLRDGKTDTAAALTKKWYKNADDMAAAFSGINPYYKLEEVKAMLYKHLDLTTDEVSMRLKGEYKKDIEAFGKVEREALSMADYFTEGIMRQFPQLF